MGHYCGETSSDRAEAKRQELIQQMLERSAAKIEKAVAEGGLARTLAEIIHFPEKFR